MDIVLLVLLAAIALFVPIFLMLLMVMALWRLAFGDDD